MPFCVIYEYISYFIFIYLVAEGGRYEKCKKPFLFSKQKHKISSKFQFLRSSHSRGLTWLPSSVFSRTECGKCGKMAALSAEIAVNGRLSAEIESCIYEISLDKIIHVFWISEGSYVVLRPSVHRSKTSAHVPALLHRISTVVWGKTDLTDCRESNFVLLRTLHFY